MTDVLFKFELPIVNFPTDTLNTPWIIQYSKEVFSLIYRRLEFEPESTANDEAIFMRYLQLSYIESKDWNFEMVIANPITGQLMLKDAFEASNPKILQYNSEKLRQKYEKFLASKSGRIDGRLFLTKKTNAIGMFDPFYQSKVAYFASRSHTS